MRNTGGSYKRIAYLETLVFPKHLITLRVKKQVTLTVNFNVKYQHKIKETEIYHKLHRKLVYTGLFCLEENVQDRVHTINLIHLQCLVIQIIGYQWLAAGSVTLCPPDQVTAKTQNIIVIPAKIISGTLAWKLQCTGRPVVPMTLITMPPCYGAIQQQLL